MRLLLTGATGYIGKRLLPMLVEEGHDVVVLVRSRHRLTMASHIRNRVTVVEGDLLDTDSLEAIPRDIDAAYYLVHSMSHSAEPFDQLEATAARNFAAYLSGTRAKQVIYLGGVGSQHNSKHMQSRRHVEELLREGGVPVTVLRAAIIIGEGSASFEIIRDLVEKLPIMIAPKWVSSRCQPISIYDVIGYLIGVLGHEPTYGAKFDIGGADVLTYKQMMLQFAQVRGLKRAILTVPVLTPRLSSYWLIFVTATNYHLARSLIESLRGDAVCEEHTIDLYLPRQPLGYVEALQRAFSRIEENVVLSSWKDAMVASRLHPELMEYVEVPREGCLSESRCVAFDPDQRGEVMERVWQIGGRQGWYAWNWAWGVRGFIDKLFGGVGLRRGRTHPTKLQIGDALDFWRVLLANHDEGHLLLYAEMRLPGEAWLEFRVKADRLEQRAVFRPLGLFGRFYWYSLMPIHWLLFSSMARRIARGR